MEDYSIETDGWGAFQVRVIRPDVSDYVAGSFPTWTHAKKWVNDRLDEEDDLSPT